jgi:hypothetical protein
MKTEHIMQYGTVIHDIIGMQIKMHVLNVRHDIIVRVHQQMKRDMIVQQIVTVQSEVVKQHHVLPDI